jgi:hypothetical protein
MTEITEYDAGRGQHFTRTVKSGADVANAQATQKMQDASRLGTQGAKPKRRPAPKQSDFGADLKAWREATRKWRAEEDADPDSQARQRALSRLK